MNHQQTTPRKIAVIGGGISGLAAAHRLIELDSSCRIALFESRSRLGGVLSTVHQDGFQIEQSADNFITTVPWGVQLCQRLGLGDQLVQTNPAFRQTFVVRSGRLHKLPDGFLMMAPTRIWPLVITPILSPWGKLRAALEYFIPRRKDGDDESMASFVRRRLGREVFQRLVEPLVSAVYAADLERLSVEATLSRFRDMEREHGSLIRAMRRQMKTRRTAASESGARYSLFVALRRGFSSLVEAIAATLPHGAVRLNAPVERIERLGDRGWALRLGCGSVETFDAVVVAAPAGAAARMLTPVDPQMAGELASIPHSGTAIISVAYRESQVEHPLDGMGIVVPAVEKIPLLALSCSSRKYPHRAPEGTVLLRVFVGGACRPEMAELDDARLRSHVLSETAKLLGIQGEPLFCSIARWPNTMPQYHVGHKQRIERIETRLKELPNLELAGNAYRGVGVPDCIHSGEQAAQRLLNVTGAEVSPSSTGESKLPQAKAA